MDGPKKSHRDKEAPFLGAHSLPACPACMTLWTLDVYAPTRMQRQGAWLHYAKGTDICLLLDDVCALCSGSKTGKAEWAGPCEPPGDKPVFLRGGRGNRSQTVCRPVRPLSRPER